MFRRLNSLAKKIAVASQRTQSSIPATRSRFASRSRFAMEDQGVSLSELSPQMQDTAHSLWLGGDNPEYEIAQDIIHDEINLLNSTVFPEITMEKYGLEYDYYHGEFSVEIARIDFTDLLMTPRFAKYKSLGKFLRSIISDFDDSSTTVSTGFHGGYKLKGNQDYAEGTTSFLLYRIQDEIGQYYGSDPKKGFAGLKNLVEDFVDEVREYVTDFLHEITQIIRNEFENIESFEYFKDRAEDNDYKFDPRTGKIVS